MAEPSEPRMSRVALMVPPDEQMPDSHDVGTEATRADLLKAIAMARTPQQRGVLQFEYDRQFNGGPSQPNATSMRDGFPELRNDVPATPDTAPSPRSQLSAYLSSLNGPAQPPAAPGASPLSLSDYLANMPPPAEPPPPKSGFVRRVLGDTALSGVQGAIGLVQSGVGLADLVTGGHVGKFLENEGGTIGLRPDEASSYLEGFKSPETIAAKKAVHDAAQEGDGFWEKVGNAALAAGQNPSAVWDMIVQSLPVQGAGGVIGRGAMWAALSAGEKAAVRALPVAERAGAIQALAPKTANLASGIGEGMVTGGQNAEQVRTDEHNPDRLLTPSQSLLMAGSGAFTGAIGAAGGALAKKAGLETSQNLMAGVRADATGSGMRSVAGRLGSAAGAGGVEAGQEFLQSGQEQAAQNLATGQPLMEGVPEQAVLGAGAGLGQGFVAHALFHDDHVPHETPDPRAAKLPDTGPMSKAFNAGQDAAGARIDAGLPATPAPQMLSPEAIDARDKAEQAAIDHAVDKATQPAPLPPAPQENVPGLLAHANQLAAKLEEKAKGTKDQTLTTPDGEKITVAGQQPEFLTPDEKAELAFLKEHGGNADALHAVYQPDTIGRMHDQAASEIQGTREFNNPTDRPPKTAQEATHDEGDFWQPGDVLNAQGAPFKNKTAVVRAQKGLSDPTSHDVVEVQGGWVLRPTANADQPAQGIARPAPATQVAVAEPAPADKPVAAKAERASDGDAGPAVAPAPKQHAAPASEARGDDAALKPVHWTKRTGDEAGFGASIGRLGDGKRTLLVDPAGGHFWGERNVGNQMGTGEVVVEGKHAAFEVANFPSQKEAVAAGNATPQTKMEPGGLAPAAGPAEKAIEAAPEPAAKTRTVTYDGKKIDLDADQSERWTRANDDAVKARIDARESGATDEEIKTELARIGKELTQRRRDITLGKKVVAEIDIRRRQSVLRSLLECMA